MKITFSMLRGKATIMAHCGNRVKDKKISSLLKKESGNRSQTVGWKSCWWDSCNSNDIYTAKYVYQSVLLSSERKLQSDDLRRFCCIILWYVLLSSLMLQFLSVTGIFCYSYSHWAIEFTMCTCTIILINNSVTWMKFGDYSLVI